MYWLIFITRVWYTYVNLFTYSIYPYVKYNFSHLAVCLEIVQFSNNYSHTTRIYTMFRTKPLQICWKYNLSLERCVWKRQIFEISEWLTRRFLELWDITACILLLEITRHHYRWLENKSATIKYCHALCNTKYPRKTYLLDWSLFTRGECIYVSGALILQLFTTFMINFISITYFIIALFFLSILTVAACLESSLLHAFTTMISSLGRKIMSVCSICDISDFFSSCILFIVADSKSSNGQSVSQSVGPSVPVVSGVKYQTWGKL